MQIILLERIGPLGQMGDIVNVKNGYARNFLLPQGKALRATKANRVEFEKQRLQLEARNLELKKEAEVISEKLNNKQFIVIRQAGDTGQLYGSVATRDISNIVTENGVSIERGQIELRQPIKTLGIHTVQVVLHPEIKIAITMNVARSEEEAERQARGENVMVIDEEVLELETFNPDEEFSDNEDGDSAELRTYNDY
ncbi:MAG: 50S ribosomal protein L9 [Hyphomicrobiaceae bacterium]|nr:50S ribosomal protein L9 [Hyphomicrobiaceae bacterium]